MFGIKVEEKKVPLHMKALILICKIIQFPGMYLAKRKASVKRKAMADKIRQKSTLRRIDLNIEIQTLEGKILALMTDEVLRKVSYQDEIDRLTEKLTDLQVELSRLP